MMNDESLDGMVEIPPLYYKITKEIPKYNGTSHIMKFIYTIYGLYNMYLRGRYTTTYHICPISLEGYIPHPAFPNGKYVGGQHYEVYVGSYDNIEDEIKL